MEPTRLVLVRTKTDSVPMYKSDDLESQSSRPVPTNWYRNTG